jgi:hypothetical protein
MTSLYSSPTTCKTMAVAARSRYEKSFSLSTMISRFHDLSMSISPPTILIDLDGVVVDWDAGFCQAWKRKGYTRFHYVYVQLLMNGIIAGKSLSPSLINRMKSYNIEDCVPSNLKSQAVNIFCSQGFFQTLPMMEDAIQALQEMQNAGLRIVLCTAPILESHHCAQEKVEWVRRELGEQWLSRLIMCTDKVFQI